MIPQAMLIKYGVVLAFLVAVFTGGCQVQRRLDAVKLQNMKTDYARAVEIIDVCQENIDTFDVAIKEQNEAITLLAEETASRINSLKAAHKEVVERLRREDNAIIIAARNEAAELRERLARLSVAEACHEAWVEVTK